MTGTEATPTPTLTPAPRFFIESARWYSSSGRLDLTLKALQRVAWINGKREEGASLSMEVRPLRPPMTLHQGSIPKPRTHRASLSEELGWEELLWKS